MRFLSVCSGIEAASVAWLPLGWECAAVSEIAPFPSAVLAHHYPEVVNRGDFTKIGADAGPIDLLVGGTPCQSFSVAGRRAGLDDARGVLAFEFLRLAGRLLPRWVVFENVPGLLSSNEGRDFGAFLRDLGRLGYGWAYRVLDAQWFGVAQRRERVFVVGSLGDWRGPVAALFEPSMLRGDQAPSREPGARVAGTLSGGSDRGGGGGHRPGHGHLDDNAVPVPYIVNAAESTAVESHARRADVARCLDGTGGFANSQGGTIVAQPVAFCGAFSNQGIEEGFTPTLAGRPMAVAFQEAQTGVREYDTAGSLRAHGPGHDPVGTRVRIGMKVRRLTPRETERLQGFPDDWTRIPVRHYQKRRVTKLRPEDRWERSGEGWTLMAADGPRYQATGNSMAVPVVRRIGERIALYEAVSAQPRGGDEGKGGK